MLYFWRFGLALNSNKQDKSLTEATGYSIASINNLNALYESMSNGTYSICKYVGNSTGAPHTGDGVVETFRNSANYGVQISSSDRGQHVRIMSTGTFQSWKEFVTKDDTELIVRSISFSYTVNANGQYNTNIKTKIDEDIPSGYSCIGIVGYTTNSQSVFPVALTYSNSSYSLQLRNISSSQVTETVFVSYLAKRS